MGEISYSSSTGGNGIGAGATGGFGTNGTGKGTGATSTSTAAVPTGDTGGSCVGLVMTCSEYSTVEATSNVAVTLGVPCGVLAGVEVAVGRGVPVPVIRVGVAVGGSINQVVVVWHSEHWPRGCPVGREWQDLQLV